LGKGGRRDANLRVEKVHAKIEQGPFVKAMKSWGKGYSKGPKDDEGWKKGEESEQWKRGEQCQDASLGLVEQYQRLGIRESKNLVEKNECQRSSVLGGYGCGHAMGGQSENQRIRTVRATEKREVPINGSEKNGIKRAAQEEPATFKRRYYYPTILGREGKERR